MRSFSELLAGVSKETSPLIFVPVQKNGVLDPFSAKDVTLRPMMFPECF